MIISQGDMNENVNMGQIRRRSPLDIIYLEFFLFFFFYSHYLYNCIAFNAKRCYSGSSLFFGIEHSLIYN